MKKEDLVKSLEDLGHRSSALQLQNWNTKDAIAQRVEKELTKTEKPVATTVLFPGPKKERGEDRRQAPRRESEQPAPGSKPSNRLQIHMDLGAPFSEKHHPELHSEALSHHKYLTSQIQEMQQKADRLQGQLMGKHQESVGDFADKKKT